MKESKGFVVFTPPVGLIVTSLHKDAVVIRHSAVKYYRYNNFYWRYKGGRYIVVRSPF